MKILVILVTSMMFIGCKSRINDKLSSTNGSDSKIALKEYAMCQCIKFGLKEDSIEKHDNSIWGITDRCDCDPHIFKSIDSLAENAARSINPIDLSGDKIKKPILLGCLNFYNSSSLDSLLLKSK